MIMPLRLRSLVHPSINNVERWVLPCEIQVDEVLFDFWRDLFPHAKAV